MRRDGVGPVAEVRFAVAGEGVVGALHLGGALILVLGLAAVQLDVWKTQSKRLLELCSRSCMTRVHVNMESTGVNLYQ